MELVDLLGLAMTKRSRFDATRDQCGPDLPFTSHPYGVGSVFIIDPAYTLPLLVGTNNFGRSMLVVCVHKLVYRGGVGDLVNHRRAGLVRRSG